MKTQQNNGEMGSVSFLGTDPKIQPLLSLLIPNKGSKALPTKFGGRAKSGSTSNTMKTWVKLQHHCHLLKIFSKKNEMSKTFKI